MRLLNARTRQLESFNDERKIPEYAILSHTWGKDEVTFRDFAELSPEQLILKEGYDKVAKCCAKSLEYDGLEWVWMDTVMLLDWIGAGSETQSNPIQSSDTSLFGQAIAWLGLVLEQKG